MKRDIYNSYGNKKIRGNVKSKKSHKKNKYTSECEIDMIKCYDCNASEKNNVYSENNHIYFNSAVNKKSIEMLINEIHKLNDKFEELCKHKLVDSVSPSPIYLHISSFGGSLLSCFKGIDEMNRSKMPIYTIVEGYAASCGSLMAVSGKKRFMGMNASHLMHQLSSGAMGKYYELVDEFENCKMFMDRIIRIYKDNTTMTEEEIVNQLHHDSWWNYEDCIEHGVVDELWQ